VEIESCTVELVGVGSTVCASALDDEDDERDALSSAKGSLNALDSEDGRYAALDVKRPSSVVWDEIP
jgi:hypothetical protein